MNDRMRSTVLGVTVLVAAVVLGAAVAEALRQDSWGPVWMIGWLPAVLVGGLYRPAARKRCMTRPMRR